MQPDNLTPAIRAQIRANACSDIKIRAIVHHDNFRELLPEGAQQPIQCRRIGLIRHQNTNYHCDTLVICKTLLAQPAKNKEKNDPPPRDVVAARDFQSPDRWSMCGNYTGGHSVCMGRKQSKAFRAHLQSTMVEFNRDCPSADAAFLPSPACGRVGQEPVNAPMDNPGSIAIQRSRVREAPLPGRAVAAIRCAVLTGRKFRLLSFPSINVPRETQFMSDQIKVQ